MPLPQFPLGPYTVLATSTAPDLTTPATYSLHQHTRPRLS